MADAVLDADPLARVSSASGLVRRGDGGEERDLFHPPGRARGEHRTGGLGAQPLVAGVGEQGDAGDEGQQLDQAGLADLGQVVDGARAGLSAEQQPPGCRAAHPHLGGIEQAQLPDEVRAVPRRPWLPGSRTMGGAGSSVRTCALHSRCPRNVSSPCAPRSLRAIDRAIGWVSDLRAYVGAMDNRFASRVDRLNVSIGNATAAESRIRDVDVAREVTALTRGQGAGLGRDRDAGPGGPVRGPRPRPAALNGCAEAASRAPERCVGALVRPVSAGHPAGRRRVPAAHALSTDRLTSLPRKTLVSSSSRRHMAVHIRPFVLQAHSLDELVATGTLPLQAARFLEAAVAAGLDVPVSGRRSPVVRRARPQPVRSSSVTDGTTIPEVPGSRRCSGRGRPRGGFHQAILSSGEAPGGRVLQWTAPWWTLRAFAQA